MRVAAEEDDAKSSSPDVFDSLTDEESEDEVDALTDDVMVARKAQALAPFLPAPPPSSATSSTSSTVVTKVTQEWVHLAYHELVQNNKAPVFATTAPPPRIVHAALSLASPASRPSTKDVGTQTDPAYTTLTLKELRKHWLQRHQKRCASTDTTPHFFPETKHRFYAAKVVPWTAYAGQHQTLAQTVLCKGDTLPYQANVMLNTEAAMKYVRFVHKHCYSLHSFDYSF